MSQVKASKTRKLIQKLASERILVLDGAMGTMIQSLGLDEEGYRGARFDAWNREVRGNNDLLNLTRPNSIRDIHYAYYKAGADIVSTNTFSSTTIAQADYGMSDIAYELNVEGARLAREAANKAAEEDGRPRFVAGALGPTNRTASISPDVANPGYRAVTFDDLRKAYGEQVRGLALRRRRRAADRDHLRHAQRQGRDLRDHGAVRDPRRRRADHDLRHHHRPLGAAAVRPDAGGVLERGAARRSDLGWIELRARRRGDARAHRRHVAGERHADLRLSECRPAERVRPLSRKPGRHGAASRRVRRDRADQHRRRLLRHDAGAHQRDCGSGADQSAAHGDRGEAVPAALGARAVHAHAGNSVRERGRAHQRHRLGQVPQARHRGRLHRGAGGCPRAGGERRADHRRQHGRRASRLGGGDEDLPQPDRGRARHRPGAGDGRFIEILGDRDRPEMHPGQAGGELDLAQGGRSGVRQACADRAPLRRGGGGDGVRRAGPGRHHRAQGFDLRARI